MSTSSPRHAVRVFVAALLAALSITASPAFAASPPAVTGLSQTSFPGNEPFTLTISGSGFTGATRVELVSRSGGGPTEVTSYTVVSDHTIKAQITPPSGYYWWVRVAGPDGESPYAGGALLDERYSNQQSWPTSQDVRCTFRGASISARLNSSFEQSSIDWDATVSPVGKTEYLGDFQGSLAVDGSAFTRNQSVRPTGPGKATSVAFDVTGAGVSSLEFISGTYPNGANTWLSTSEDGNPVEFRLAPNESNQLAVPNLSTPGHVVGKVRVITIDAEMSDGSTAELRCTPTASAPVFEYETLPVPTLSPASGPAAGGNVVRILGSGLKPNMKVEIDYQQVASTFVSSNEITFIAPAHAPGTAKVHVGQLDETTATYTYTGSTPFESRTLESTATCPSPSVAGAVLHPKVRFTATTQQSLQPGEVATIAGGSLSLIFPSAQAPSIPESSGISFLVRSGGSFSAQGATATGTYSDATRQPDLSAPDGSTRSLNYSLSFSGPSLGAATAPAGGAVTLAGGSFRVYAIINVDAGSEQLLNCTFDSATPLVRIPVVSEPTPTPTPSPTPATAVDVALKGAATLKTLAKGSVPLTGSLKGQINAGAFAGDLALSAGTANLVAYGFLPVTAKLAFTQMTQTTGTLTSAGALATSTKVRVKLPSVKLFGIELVSGATCQAANPTILGLKSPAFTAGGGGQLTGTFAISNLTGCGALGGIVSPLTAGNNNAIALTATPATG